MSVPSIDVVIATYNRHERLTRTLRSLQRQTTPDFGVIVVDDGSDPPVQHTVPRDVAEQLGVRFLATQGNRGPAAARNLGIAASEATLIAFIDDDVDADPVWMEAHLAALNASHEPAVTIGPLLAPPDWRPTPWNRWEAARLAVEYTRMQRGEYAPTWRQFFTGNATAPRSLLSAAGGFNESLRRAEDIELALRMARLGAWFTFVPEAKGWHYAFRTRDAWLGNAEQYARVDVAMDRLYPEIGWLGLIDDELRRRPFASRATRAAATRLFGRDRAAASAAIASRWLNRGPLTPVALRAASLAYDIRYRAALESARRSDVAIPGMPPGNVHQTVHQQRPDSECIESGAR